MTQEIINDEPTKRAEEAGRALLDRLAYLERIESAWREWNDKTEFVQEWMIAGKLPAKYLGMHRADVLHALANRLEQAEKERDELKAAALRVLSYTEAAHRPPKREPIPAGGTARVRIEVLADLHDLVADKKPQSAPYVMPSIDAMQGEGA